MSFESLNLLPQATLSALTMQLQALVTAMRSCTQTISSTTRGINATVTEITIAGQKCLLNPSGAWFATTSVTHPAFTQGVTAVSLPEALKLLYRPVVISAPDAGVIAEYMLLAAGFTQAKVSESAFRTEHNFSCGFMAVI